RVSAKRNIKEIEKEMSWSSIILVAFRRIPGDGALPDRSCTNWIALGLLGNLGGLSPILMIFVVVLSVSLMNITLSSATVSASIVIPIIIELSINLGISTLAIAFPAALASSLAFILIIYSDKRNCIFSGVFFNQRFCKGRVLMSIVSCVIVAVVMYGVGLLTGLY
ncbi:MAG: anion permease, partial [Enterocloster sp.]